MIQANELRVGNRFIRELHTHNRGLDYDKDFVLDEDNMGLLFSDIRLALDDLFPIPITVELLTELGFKNNGAMYSKPEDCVIDFELTYVFIYSEKNEDDIKYPLPKALHLLQNLYFFVTGVDAAWMRSKVEAISIYSDERSGEKIATIGHCCCENCYNKADGFNKWLVEAENILPSIPKQFDWFMQMYFKGYTPSEAVEDMMMVV